MPRYVIAGGHGMLGVDLAESLAGRDVTVLSRKDLDITELAAVRRALAGHDVVINAAAYTRVDDAESDEDAAYAVNATGAHNLAIAASETGATLVQVSTDYVFDGTATTPYSESAPLNPASAYGRTKAAGEVLSRAANANTIVVRTAWLYGKHGGNFAKTMLRLAGERDQVSVVADQVGQPTWTRDVATMIISLLDAGVLSGVFHATSAGQASWCDFARAIFETQGLDPARVIPTDSSTFVRPAQRPAYSVLGHDAWSPAGLAAPRDWLAALRAASDEGVLDSAVS